MQLQDEKLQSSALQANLARTAAVVEVPERFKVLLQSVEDYYGVHKRVQDLLVELHHPFVNYDYVIDNVKAFAINDFHKINQHAKAGEALQCVFDIFFSVIEADVNERARDRALKFMLDFVDTFVSESGEHRQRNQALLASVFTRLTASSAQKNYSLKKCSSHARALLMQSGQQLCQLSSFVGFLQTAFSHNYQYWLSVADPAGWFDREVRAGLTSFLDKDSEHERIQALKRLVEPLSHASLRRLFADFVAIGLDGIAFEPLRERLASLPDYSRVLNAYLLVADQIEKEPVLAHHLYLIKLDFLFNILNSGDLAEIHGQALQEVNRLLSLGFNEEPPEQRAGFVQKILGSLREISLQPRFRSIVYNCMLTLAREIVKLEDRQLFDQLQEGLIGFGFQYPDVTGSNAEWQVQVNPDHIKNIRTWMEIIALKPAWSRRLLSALIVNLKLGGVLIRDTDLFQRDITTFLNADISRTVNLSKQLLRLFPAFFNEIGAEGELRDISTRADELCMRRDILVHFIRKQSHVESNNLLVKFIENSFYFWNTGNRQFIRQFVPPEVFAQIDTDNEYFVGLNKAFSAMFSRCGGESHDFLALDEVALRQILSGVSDLSDRDRERASCLIRMFQLLTKKYNPQPIDLIKDLQATNLYEPERILLLQQCLSERNYRKSLELVIEFMEKLQQRILDPQVTTPSENIYFKRHIAAGIPSMYGVYREEKFDALGLSLRLESLGTSLFEQLIETMELKFITKSTIVKILDYLPLFLKAFELEGIATRQLASKIDFVKLGIGVKLFSIDQYQDIFIAISKAIQGIIGDYYLDMHRSNLPVIIGQLIRHGHPATAGAEGEDDRAFCLASSESFMRSLLASAFGLQVLDNFITRIVNILQEELDHFRDKKAILNLVTTYNPDLTVSDIYEDGGSIDNPILLGNKGYWLKRLASFGFPIPRGFVVTTEVYRCFDAVIGYRNMLKDLTGRILSGISRLEKATGKRFGDPVNPLLLSVRSGAAISMPGMMDTFLNVGINRAVCEKLSARPGYAWAAWDSYRRFLQMWGMSSGLDRNFFDGLIETYKEKFNVAKKLQFKPEQMKEIALCYREELHARGIKIFDNPIDQLRYAILKAFQSWDSECAKIFRRQMNLSNDWGTAVTVQEMVFGNLNENSGSGVTFTRAPGGQSSEIELFGDFFFGVQGDDIVSGLIETFPVSEVQRRRENRNCSLSLESQFPQIYEKLVGYAHHLIRDKGFNHQEIEFTFENQQSDGLYILQTRDQYQNREINNVAFVDTPALRASLLGNGVGVGGGAISGRAVFSEREIRKFRKISPDVPLILIRPDTVPEDVGLLLQVEALLTARGGRTSHAAVTIPQLGKVGVVGFNKLKVYETESFCLVGSHKIQPGDYLSLDGGSGAVYHGQHQPEAC